MSIDGGNLKYSYGDVILCLFSNNYSHIIIIITGVRNEVVQSDKSVDCNLDTEIPRASDLIKGR